MSRLFVILTFFALIIGIPVSPAQLINQKLINNQNGEEILIGYCSRQAFQEGQYKEWFDDEYRYFTWSKHIHLIDSIRNELDSMKITVVLGTWCSDSKLQFPRFMGLLDYAGFDDKNLLLVCVDRNKKTISENIDDLKIEHVPTFIFYKNNREIGRIIESPSESLEEDMFKMIRWKKPIGSR